MRLLLDEDSGSRSLLKALRDRGHDVERVVDVAELGGAASDAAVFSYAVTTARVLVTKNGADFIEIARRAPDQTHSGILVLHYGTSDGRALPIPTIVRAIENIDAAYESLTDLILSVNQHTW